MSTLQSLIQNRNDAQATVDALKAQLAHAQSALAAATEAIAAHKDPIQSEYDTLGEAIAENVARRTEVKAARKFLREQSAATPNKLRKAKVLQQISDNTSHEYELEEKCKELRARRSAVKSTLDSFKKPSKKATTPIRKVA